MKTLTRYIGRDVLFATLAIFAALLSLFAFFDLINELADVGKSGYTLSAAALFVALHLPSRLYELFPVAALIGTLFALAQLVANSEYTVMRASGASLWRIGWAVVRVGIPLAIATFLAGEVLTDDYNPLEHYQLPKSERYRAMVAEILGPDWMLP